MNNRLSKKESEQLYFKLRKRRMIFIWIFFIIAFVSSDLVRTYYHESAHQEIFKHAGIESHMGFKIENPLLFTFYVQPNNSTLASERCDIMCASLQEENEIYTYNISAIFYSIWILAGIYLANKHMIDY